MQREGVYMVLGGQWDREREGMNHTCLCMDIINWITDISLFRETETGDMYSNPSIPESLVLKVKQCSHSYREKAFSYVYTGHIGILNIVTNIEKCLSGP